MHTTHSNKARLTENGSTGGEINTWISQTFLQLNKKKEKLK